MPTISMFYGILILLYFYDDKKHSMPHIHAEYGEHEVSIAIEDGSVLCFGWQFTARKDEIGTSLDRNPQRRLVRKLEIGCCR